MKKILLVLLSMCLILGSVMPAAIANNDNKIYLYVATDGNENGDGSFANPFSSIEKARDEIRRLRASGNNPAEGFVVYLRGGNYGLDKGIVFDAQDSGTSEAPIVYAAYPGEKAMIVGGASISAKHFVPLNNEDIRARVIDETAKTKIMQIDLGALGYNNFGENMLRGAYSYIAPLPTNTPSPAPDLVVDNKLMTLARYPNDGNMHIRTIVKEGFNKDGSPNGEEDQRYTVEDGFIISPQDDRIKYWTNATDALMHGFWRYDWADQSVYIKNIDVENNTIESHIGSLYGVIKEQRFYVYNLPEEIDIPGEYYLDRETNILYLYPPEGFSENSDVKISVFTDKMVTFDNASFIDFNGIDFTTSRASAVIIKKGSKNIRIMNATLEYTSDYAIKIEEFTYNCGVVNCYIHDVDGGVSMSGGERKSLTPGNNYVENCEIEKFSRITKTYRAAVGVGGVGNRASHNEIHDGPHLAVSFSGFDPLVEYNEIYDVVNDSDDMAAIYGGQTWLGRGLKVIGNYIHDITTGSGQTVGIAGVYLDGCQCDCTVEGNIFENIAGDGVKINGGRSNITQNNIFVNCKAGVNLCDVLLSQFSYERRINSIIKSPIWDNLEDEPWAKEPFTSKYPNMMAMLEDEPNVPKYNTMHNNLVVNGEEFKLTQINENLIDMKNNYVTGKNPGFKDMMLGNYNLREDSIVFTEIPGFVAPDMNKMGRYKDNALYEVKDDIVLLTDSPKALCYTEAEIIDKDNLDIKPMVKDGKIFVPIRFISENLGFNVGYDGASRSVTFTKGNTNVVMTIDNDKCNVNGVEITLSDKPFVFENRTFVSAADVKTALGVNIHGNDIIVVGENALSGNSLVNKYIKNSLFVD
ncbi:MAG: right-handed parallel beta-helix repeat-containing protein [Clostridia bacterium]|nr:right-handed parallel beta-helix repeat-containing protein [Clostridia bacterium]